MSTSEQDIAPAKAPSAISNKINVLKIPTKGINIKIEPDEELRAKFAEELAIEGISSFRAFLTATRWHKDGVRIAGPLKARLTQACVATLEPVAEEIDIEINAVFIPETSKLAKTKSSGEGQELLIDPEGDDVPELFELPFLDVGDVAAEFFALALDPYPRSINATDELVESSIPALESKGDEKENPFAALASLKDKL